MTQSPRWKRRPPGSNWGDFGPDDQLGRINLLTPERIREAAREVREGRAFCLSLPLDYPGGSVLNPRRWPPKLVGTGTPNPATLPSLEELTGAVLRVDYRQPG